MPAEVDLIEGTEPGTWIFRVGGLPLVGVAVYGVATLAQRTVGPDLLWLLRLACDVSDGLRTGQIESTAQIRGHLEEAISARTVRRDLPEG